MKSGQAHWPLVKCVHIPSLSEGIQANPDVLRQKGDAFSKNSQNYSNVNLMLSSLNLKQHYFHYNS